MPDGYLRTAILLAAMTALFLGLGYLIAGAAGLLIALLLAGGMNLWSFWNSDKAVLRMHGAREVDASSAPGLFAMVRDLSGRAGLPMPRVFVVRTDQPNAFATGRGPGNAAVAVTTGLLDRLPAEELSGVVAHELAHIRNRDTLLMTVTATFAGAIAFLGNFALFFGGGRNNPLGFVGALAMMIVAPLAAGLVQMAISRTREYAADRGGAEICGNPLWLAGALERMSAEAARTDNAAAERNPATAHMFIVNPLHGHGHDRLFATHPATANRVAALREMAGAGRAAGRAAGPWGVSGVARGARAPDSRAMATDPAA